VKQVLLDALLCPPEPYLDDDGEQIWDDDQDELQNLLERPEAAQLYLLRLNLFERSVADWENAALLAKFEEDQPMSRTWGQDSPRYCDWVLQMSIHMNAQTSKRWPQPSSCFI
jgi:hypothetical protein